MTGPSEAASLLDGLKASELHGAELRKFAMQLASGLEGYDWCGVYRLEGDSLVLDEFVGEPTKRTRIPVGRGVCGTAVAEGRNLVVADVTNIPNYLSCDIRTRSEIVVLIRDGERVLGQIDIDSHSIGAFDASDERLLEEIAAGLARRWASESRSPRPISTRRSTGKDEMSDE
ncbi:MAG: GAF domain-containing protein [Armatimonadetes bacterium]|nr:GAF domain-containing protein [Armatimonadota bacterium]